MRRLVVLVALIPTFLTPNPTPASPRPQAIAGQTASRIGGENSRKDSAIARGTPHDGEASEKSLSTAKILSTDQSLSTAGSLYASAAYEDALSLLADLGERTASPDAQQRIDEYRLYCLVALDRAGEAESVAAALLGRNPLYRLDANEASPRIRSLFTSVRRRLLTETIQQEYRQARAEIARKDYIKAEPLLTHVRSLLDERRGIEDERQHLGDEPRLSDEQQPGDERPRLEEDQAFDGMRLAIDGLLDLSRAARTDRSSSSDPAPPVASRPPTERSIERPTARPIEQRIYGANDPDVDPPVVVFQQAPTMDAPAAGAAARASLAKAGMVSVLIAEDGSVKDAAIIQPIHPFYDQLLVRAAFRWKYRPARKNGAAVRYRKIIRIEVEK